MESNGTFTARSLYLSAVYMHHNHLSSELLCMGRQTGAQKTRRSYLDETAEAA